MYCSSCGATLVQGLSYCNHCGAKLAGAKDETAVKSPEVKPELIVSAMVAGFIFGILAIAVLLGVMKRVDFNMNIILAITAFSFALLLTVEGMLIWLLLRRKRSAEDAGGAAQLSERTTKELGAAPVGALAEPVSSVTEHTTRSFEPIYSERQPK